MRQSLAALSLIGALAACATSPTGRSQLMLVSEEDAIAVSSDAYRQELAPYARSGRLDNAPATTQRVRAITGRLVAQAIRLRPETAEWQWSIKVIDDPKTINAWAMAGGKMAIYTGLIERLNATDDELAQVLGHEIAHALAKHSAEKMSQAIATQAGVLAVGVATGSEAAMQAAAAAAQLAITLPYGRGAESEADRIGIELAARSGYDPRAAISLWRKMDAAAESQPPEFLSTHPSPESRIEALSALVPQMTPLYREAQSGQLPSHPINDR